MKKIFLSLTFLAVSLGISLKVSAQLPNGTICPDWTGTDINGTSWHLYDLLDQGKTVFIDVSATWCSPCWNYHTGVTNGTGGVPALEKLYSDYGPSGTNELMVFFIEGDNATTNADLNGTGTNTQGDWVTGTLYPIIDDAAIGNTLLDISYFPTIYMVCPDRIITENGQLTAAAHKAKMDAGCFTAVAGNDVGVTSSPDLFDQFFGCNAPSSVQFRIGNYGSSTLTSCNLAISVNGGAPTNQPWTGSLAPYATQLVTINPTGGVGGDNTLTVTCSSPNGSSDVNAANNSKDLTFFVYPTTGASNIVEGFEGTTPPDQWFAIDPDANGTWFPYSASGDGGFGNSDGGGVMEMYYSPNGNIDDYQAPAASFVGMAHPLLKFDMAYAEYSSNGTTYKDRLKIRVSSDCGSTWSTPYDLQGDALMTGGVATSYFIPSASQWRTEYVDLTAFSGQQQVLVKFQAVSGYGNNVFIDNVNLTSGNGISNSKIVAEEMSIYPNPSSDVATVNFSLTEASDVNILVTNTLGEIVMVKGLGQLSAGNLQTTLGLENLASGLYKVTLQTGSQSQTQKLSVIK